MAVALEQFVKQLADSGVIAPGKLEGFVPPKAQPKDAQELARQLVSSKQLTKYQVQEIYQGRAKSLILGNYTIVDKIGAGGMGQVFKAEHRRMHRVVAIKMLPKNIVQNAAAAARFQREVEAASKLMHPNIVSAFDADEAGGVHFLVMEYIEGSDLSAIVKKDGPLSVRKSVHYILQAAKGLEFAHAEHVVHRDIKPANLLVDKKGTVRILDMGLARIETEADAATQAELTGTGAVMGTVDYMAPEQGLSTKSADARADIYSLGCTLHYLLIGKPAYVGETITAKLLAHHREPIPNLRKLREDVPEELQAIFSKMVAKKIEDRYQTMSEVVAALESLEAGASGVQTSLSIQQSVETKTDADVLTFLTEIPAAPAHKPKPGKKVASLATGKWNKKFLLGAVGAGSLIVMILVAVIFKMHTKDGTLVVEINQPDATVRVLDADGTIEISQPGGKGSVSISVDPGKHQLKVEKAGFNFFAQDFEMDSGGTATIKAMLEPVKGVTATVSAGPPNQPWKTPAFQQWIKTVATLPAEKQVEAVAKKLAELNPGFDGKATGWDGNGPPNIESGAVIEIGFVTDNVTDMSPVRALAGLKKLKCAGSIGERGILADLSPLQGMPLTHLNCGQNPKLSDLSPLKGISLTELDCDGTPISDLSTLKGMPLASLACYGTQVSDLSPLKDMKLTGVLCYDSPVSDLSPLKGMPLTWLDCHHTTVSDLSPLQGMPLTVLGCGVTPVSDLSPLKGMPLTWLDCHDTAVSDLSPLQGMTLATVLFTPININNGLNVIRQMDTVKTIGVGFENKDQFPPNEFWKSYDAGEFNKAASSPDAKLTATQPASPSTASTAPAPAPTVKPSVAKDSRLPIPEEAARLKAEQRLQDLLKTDLAQAKLPEQKSVLAERLLKQADSTPNDPAAKYATLEESLRLAIDIGDAAVLQEAIDALAATYVVDAPETWADALETTTKKPHVPPINRSLAEAALGQMDQSMAHDRYELAVRFQATALAAARRARDAPLLKSVVERGKSLAAAKTLWEAAEKARPVLAKSPDDAAANLALGKYLCFVKGEWDQGFVHLSKGNDATLAGLATQSLTKPSDPTAQKALGDAWWKAAESADGARKAEFHKGSDYWYSVALPGLTGSTKSRVEERIQSGPPTTARAYVSLATQKWLNEVAALPAEKQVEAVAKKLVELNPRFDGQVTPKIEDGAVTGLNFNAKNVTDISPVQALTRLQELGCAGGGLSDLSPLKGMPLHVLSCGGNPIFDLSPLRGMPLSGEMSLAGCPVHDLSPLAGMRFTYLNLENTQIRDVEALKGMPLTSLCLLNCQVSNLEPLKGMPLTSLDLRSAPVQDLKPLQNLPLTFLWLGACGQVRDLGPLKGLPLTVLWLDGCAQVRDLEPLKGLPLTRLWIHGSGVTDLSPLQGMKLEEIRLTPKNITRGTDSLRGMKSLNQSGQIGTVDEAWPAAQFWKKFDAGEFNK